MSDLTYPKAINPVVNSILDDAIARGILNGRQALQAYLGLTEAAVYARTRQNPQSAWSDTELRTLMSVFVAQGADDLAGRILTLMIPGFDVGFRSQFLGAAPAGVSIYADEGRLVSAIGQLCEEIAEALGDDETPDEIDPAEADRVLQQVAHAQERLNAVSADVQRRRPRHAR